MFVPELESPAPAPSFTWTWGWIFLLLTGLLSSTILLKVAEIQYLEILDALQLLGLLALFIHNRLQARVLRAGLVFGAFYLVFMIGALALSLVALSRPFFIPGDVTLLKQPVWITLSRIAELAIDAGITIYLFQIFTVTPSRFLFTLKVYFWASVASAGYSFVSLPLHLATGLQVGVYNSDNRMRGFYNEGGPYGLYVISAMLVGVALLRLGQGNRFRLRAGILLLFAALLGSRSKAAICAFAVLLVLDALIVKGVRRKILVICSLAASVAISIVVVDVPAQLRIYRRGMAAYEYLSHLREHDVNFVYGRVAGAFLVPRMIRAHPYTGIGWGNYGLVRNDSVYRGASAWATFADAPGLGFFGFIAELGIPLSAFLVLC
ncbi:MAG: O-antigen ligase family protein, partial [Acidobacteriota bacterium]